MMQEKKRKKEVKQYKNQKFLLAWEKRKDVQWVSFFLFFLTAFIQPKRRHASNAKGHHKYHAMKIGQSQEKKTDEDWDEGR